MQSDSSLIGGSFKDPSGFVFSKDGEIYRQINFTYKNNYEMFMRCGLYDKLVEANTLIPHREVSGEAQNSNIAYKIIKPERISFISYPYEWCFGQLKDAALLTLNLQKTALDFDMTLKDASAFNIQFVKGNPKLIDTLSFEKYDEGEPWIAYKQFCEHFLGPLVLMAFKDYRLSQLFKVFINGIPLDLVSSVLPKTSWLNPGIFIHIHLHSKAQKKYEERRIFSKKVFFSKTHFYALIDNLQSVVEKLKLNKKHSHWKDYYVSNNYSPHSFEFKKSVILDFIDILKPFNVWDLGCNTGGFSEIAASKNIETIAFDNDFFCIEDIYNKSKFEKILPLFLDLLNPTPSLGWANLERDSLIKRGPADLVMALALIHHLAISCNIPFIKIADFFSKICNWLIIEFVEKEDSMAQKLFNSRKDIFPHYNSENFKATFEKKFITEKTVEIPGSHRTLYLMRAKK